MDAIEFVRAFGRFGEIGEIGAASAKLREVLKFAVTAKANAYLSELASEVIANETVPISEVRYFLLNIPSLVLPMRTKGRRTILYEVIHARDALVIDILHRTPGRVLTSVDSNGMTPYHYACRHGSAESIISIGTLTPEDARARLSRTGRSPLMEALYVLRGSSIIGAIVDLTSNANLWQTRDRYGMCVLHYAVCSGDAATINKLLDRVESVSDLIDETTGRSVISTAMDTEMSLAQIVNLVGCMKRRCPGVLGDLLNSSSVKITDAVDIFQRTINSAPVVDTLIMAIPPDRMFETLSRRRGLSSSTIFHITATYPFAFVKLVGFGVSCGMSSSEMFSVFDSVSGTPMHILADWCYANLCDVVSELNMHCDMCTIVHALFVSRSFDMVYAFECLRTVRDLDYLLELALSCAPELMAVARVRSAIVRHAVRVGSNAVFTGPFRADLENAISRESHEILQTASQSVARGNGNVNVIILILKRINPRDVSPQTERDLLLACTLTTCGAHWVHDFQLRDSALFALHTMCQRVRAIRRWRNLRQYVKTRWFVIWWFEEAARLSYAPGGAIFIQNRNCVMSLVADDAPRVGESCVSLK